MRVLLLQLSLILTAITCGKIDTIYSFRSKKLIAVVLGYAIRCYQCSSDEDKSKDTCGSYEHFDTLRNPQVDCASAEADVPGMTFICVVCFNIQ